MEDRLMITAQAGQDSQEAGQQQATSSKAPSTRGGTREQHVKAGRAGGNAPHRCRGRQCSKESK